MASHRRQLDAIVQGIETDYAELAELLDRTGSPLAVAELHGGLCGVLSASGLDAGARWLMTVLDDCDGDDGSLSQLAKQLESLGNETWRALCGLSLEFEPLMPDDEADIELRAEALGLWCHGYLAGLVVGGMDLGVDSTSLTPEIEELVKDFVEISKAGADTAEISDANLGDRSLIELIEFVRIGVQYVFEELAPESSVERTIH